ncbi:MAG: 3-hydroxyacyl-CoA dehydrogenase family protein [Deltaproteobacteria bacterium]|nr:3-hydroxyacyl-CoA dehydrogenase family protein [Deltaproteobacteria bacterium]
MTIKKVLVIGAGTMGSGIAQLCAQQGLDAILADVSKELADKGKARLAKGMAGRVEKGKMTQAEMDQVLARITTAGDLACAKDADLVIESVVENLDVKRQVFAEVDQHARPGTILCTNTTSLSISAIAEGTRHPEQLTQMHFFNPPVIMKLVEIMPGKKTAADTVKAAAEFARALGKDPVVCHNEAPAGIVSRALGQLLNEATWMVEAGVAEPADIDKAMKLGANHPMGPLELIDLIGLDVHRAKMQTLRTVLDDPRYQHPKVVDRMIEEGRLGTKAGRGFYTYESK